MAFNDVVQLLDTTHVVAIVTRRSDGSPVATPIWSVVIDGVPYLRSANGPTGWWYRHVLAGREVAFAMGDGKIAERDREAALELPTEVVRVEHVPVEDAIQSSIDDALRSKYSSEPSSVAAMLDDKAVACTLRVLAADA